MKPARWIALATALALAGCGDAFLGALPQKDRSAIFDQIWQDMDLHYSFFQMKQANWDSLGGAYRPAALSASTDLEFATVVGQMMAQLHDVHVSVTPLGSGSTIRYISPYDTASTYFNSSLVYEKYVAMSWSTPGGHMRYGMAAPTVGYVRIPDFTGSGWAPEMDLVLQQLPNAASLVIDLRNNRGGSVTVATNVAGRFADRKRTYGYVRVRNGPAHSDFTNFTAETVQPAGPRQFHGSVYVLTNRRNFSSAEDFVLAMRTIPQVTIVGDTTAGASGGPIQRQLANGWGYEFSEWIEYTSVKRIFEGLAWLRILSSGNRPRMWSSSSTRRWSAPWHWRRGNSAEG